MKNILLSSLLEHQKDVKRPHHLYVTTQQDTQPRGYRGSSVPLFPGLQLEAYLSHHGNKKNSAHDILAIPSWSLYKSLFRATTIFG